MSCLDVMYHQSYGAHYLPAEAYKATYYNHQQQQQRKLSSYTKMQTCLGQQQQQAGGRGMLSRDQDLRQDPAAQSGCASESGVKDGTQPAGAEYLNSRCILFTYFQGDISDEVDEHFSRALSQSGTFNRETKPTRLPQSSVSNAADSWKDAAPLPDGHGSPLWNNTYPAHPAACLPSVSVSVHPDFSPSPDGALWAGHVLSHPSLPPLHPLPDSWTYSLNSPSASGYPNVHEVYHPHPHAHIHTRHHQHHHHHHHPMLHSYPAPSAARDSRFSPLLLSGVRSQSQQGTSTGSSPHSEGAKTEMDPSRSSPITPSSAPWTPPALHGSLELFDSALDQTKVKTSVWF